MPVMEVRARFTERQPPGSSGYALSRAAIFPAPLRFLRGIYTTTLMEVT